MNVPDDLLPDRWFVKRIEHSKNEAAWWIAANPKRGEGKIFAKGDWEAAVSYARERAQAQGLGEPTTEK